MGNSAVAVDPKSVTLGFGQIMMVKRREGRSLGLTFEREGEEVFTVWFANPAGAEALARNASLAERILMREQGGSPTPEYEWQVVAASLPTKDQPDGR